MVTSTLLEALVYPVIFLVWKTARFNETRCLPYILAQPQSLPQLHALPLFIGQFLPVLLQLGLSAANETVHSAATKIENKIFG